MKILLKKGISWVLDPNDYYDYLSNKEIIDFCGSLPKSLESSDVNLFHHDFIQAVKKRYGLGLKGCNYGNLIGKDVLKLKNDDELHPLMIADIKGDNKHSIRLYPYGLMKIISKQREETLNTLLIAQY